MKPDKSQAQSFLSQTRKFSLSRRGCRHVLMMGGGIVSCLVMSDLWRLSWGWRVRVTSSGFRCFQNPPASLVTVTNTALTSTPSSHILTSSLVTPFFLYTALFILFLCHYPTAYIPPVSNFLFLYFFKIVICGQRDSPDTAALLATVNSLFLPHKVRTWKGCVISNGCVSQVLK